MDKADKKFAEKLLAWLSSEDRSETACIEGATMVLQITKNRALYNTIMRKPLAYAKKIEYELKKHQAYYADGLTLTEVQQMNVEVSQPIQQAIDVEKMSVLGVPEAEKPVIINKLLGKRADHDSLHPSVQKLWTDNAERWKKIKEVFEGIKTLTMPCDRYEYLKQLKELWYKYKEDMKSYDEAKIDTQIEATANEADSGNDIPADGKALTNARSYISKNIEALTKLHAESGALVTTPDAEGTDEEHAAFKKYLALRKKMQQRVDLLVGSKEVFKPESIENLSRLGVNFPEENGEG